MGSSINLFVGLFLVHIVSINGNSFEPISLKCEYLVNPQAVQSPNPRLSWNFVATDPMSQNLTQSAFQILVGTSESLLGDLWDSGKIPSDQNIHVKYGGTGLEPGQRAYWTVIVWDQNGEPSLTRPIAHWDNGLKNEDWVGEWIKAPAGLQDEAKTDLAQIDTDVMTALDGLKAVVFLRKEFQIPVASNVTRAKIYSSAKGAYKVLLNGGLVSDEELAPGWTDFTKTIQYQSYDVTTMIQEDANAVGVILGTGWFSGYIGFSRDSDYYGTEQSFLFELHLDYADGSKRVVVSSDESWKSTIGPLIYSDMLHGELYYENRDLSSSHQGLPDWATVGYTDDSWVSTEASPIDLAVDLVSDRAEPVRVTQELKPIAKHESNPGVWVLDFGQNMVGWVKIHLAAGTPASRIQLRHAEVLEDNGTIYILNLRSALATDTYVLSQPVTESYSLEPHFTFHGFRYLEVRGWNGEPDLADFTGRVVGSDTPLVGKFSTSHALVNKLYENIVWGQRGNFLSVPTDCPQRDERLGWMGDAQVFIPTATYNADVAAFFTKYMKDTRDAQGETGGFSDVSPRLVDWADGSPAWGDAGIIVPYFVYLMYGDLEIIEENFSAMERWIEYIHSVNPDLIWTDRVNNNFGDWLNVGAETPKDLLATAYFAYDSLLLSKMAYAVNRTEEGNKYKDLHSRIAAAFQTAFLNQEDGVLLGDTQTAYLQALAMDMLPEDMKPLASELLAQNVRDHDNHLTTGFVGVGYINSVLSQYGHNDLAYKLLVQETYPSWLYSIKHNATTIWERWDGWTETGGFQDPGMNSFNHYSLGSVGKWMFQSAAGIDTDPAEPGFKKIIIRPMPDPELDWVAAEYNSIRGLIKSSWSITGDLFTLEVSIPINTRATVDLRFTEIGGVYEIGSGDYTFSLSL